MKYCVFYIMFTVLMQERSCVKRGLQRDP